LLPPSLEMPSLRTCPTLFAIPTTDAELADRLKQAEQSLTESMKQIDTLKQHLGVAQKETDELRRIIGDRTAIAPHNTRLMKIAIQVQRDYWKNLDERPKQEALKADLIAKYALSGVEAHAVELVACPIDRKK